MGLVMILVSCNKKLNHVLDLAGDNRGELETVLQHFKDDPNPLKYKSAKFLIENMSSQYHMVGKSVDMLDSVYILTSNVCQDSRTKYFETVSANVDQSQAEISYDLTTMKADFLIKAINDACDAWSNSTWSEDYDESIFFEYVLPYRLTHERMTDWHQTICEEYPLLTKNLVMSRRGLQLEADHDNTMFCETMELVGASNGKAEMMLPNVSSISYTVDAPRSTQKHLIMKYASTAHNLKATISVNGVKIQTLHLAPTQNRESFMEKWFNFSMPIKKGRNTITISAASDTLCIDYIQLGALENFSHDDCRDFSFNYYNIVNVKSQLCITYDTLCATKNRNIGLRAYCAGDSTQLLRMDYVGYPLWRIGYYKRDSLDMCLQVQSREYQPFSLYSPIISDKCIKCSSVQWVFIPVGDSKYRIMNKHTGLFLDSYRDSISKEDILIQNKYTGNESQIWMLRKQGVNPYADRYFRANSAISEAMRIFDITHQFEYYIYSSPFSTNTSSLFKTKSGKCADETSFTIYLCRHLGIPSAYDFTPHWGNRSGSHSWSVLINEQGKSIPFYMGKFPGDTALYYHSYIKPKVFRYRYSVNKQMVLDMKHETSIPDFLKKPHFTDVTDEYCNTSDIVRPIPKKYKNKRVAYICVFDNRNWVPVHYGVIQGEKVSFKSMGRGIAYMTGLYENGTIIPFGNPFILTNDGNIKDLSSNKENLVSMKLLRKYPFMGVNEYFNRRMDGGMFMASNKKDFSDSTILHKHNGITNGNWYSIPVKCNKEFKYLRYMGGCESFCNINELEFYSSNGKKLDGTIIGTDGEPWARKEYVFDGNILTGFSANSPNGNWVGLKLKKPSKVSKIKYIGRNDGNGIEVGDVYELYYWNRNGYWNLLGSQKATDNVLHFYNIPSNGLYLLIDVTKGREERIFTYENGKQVWW